MTKFEIEEEAKEILMMAYNHYHNLTNEEIELILNRACEILKEDKPDG